MRGLRATTTIIVAGLAVAATVAWRQPPWTRTWSSWIPDSIMLAAIWLLVAATVVMLRWRPMSRLWVAMAALSLVWSWFTIAVTTSIGDGGLLNPAVLLRPTLYFLLLAWPSGFMRRSDRTWWIVYSCAQALLLSIVPQLFQEAVRRPFVVADVPSLVRIAHAFGLALVLPTLAVVLFVSIRHHARRLPDVGARTQAPIVVAAGINLVSELGLSVLAPIEHRISLEAVNLFVALNFLPLAATPILAIVAVRRSQASTSEFSTIEVGDAGMVVRRALQRSDVDVRFAGRFGEWLDVEGRVVSDASSGARIVEIRRDDVTLATVSFGEEISIDEIERAVAAAGASADFARLGAVANANRREADTALRTMLEARDSSMAKLERDLHDGAQQRLVGLALQASMARRLRTDTDQVAADLYSGLEAARREIAEAASGLFPMGIANRGLATSIATLAACSALRVEVDVDLPSDIPADVVAAAWFVAAEAVANATKHADATRLRIGGSVETTDGGTQHLEMIIEDDGRGGANMDGSGIAGVRTRIHRLRGELEVLSPPGSGTVVRARFPLTIPAGVVS